MKYDKVVKAIFIERPNRFIARVKIDGAEEVGMCHGCITGWNDIYASCSKISRACNQVGSC